MLKQINLLWDNYIGMISFKVLYPNPTLLPFHISWSLHTGLYLCTIPGSRQDTILSASQPHIWSLLKLLQNMHINIFRNEWKKYPAWKQRVLLKHCLSCFFAWTIVSFNASSSRSQTVNNMNYYNRSCDNDSCLHTVLVAMVIANHCHGN